ncbi:hypothetical protein EJB05_21266, partial [Eragrostis curvula]
MECAEASLPETHDFVFRGLLLTEDRFERAFRIVEVELGFCHDYFFTKYHVIRKKQIFMFVMMLVRIILVLLVGAFVLTDSLTIETPAAVIEVHPRRADTVITLLILGTIILVEVLQAAFYLASDWLKVSLACKYVRNLDLQSREFIVKLIRAYSRFTIFRYWTNRIGQCSVISECQSFAIHLRYILDPIKNPFERTYRLTIGKKRASVCLTSAVKIAVARSLKESDGHLTNGEATLKKNHVFGLFCWALEVGSQIEIILVWHIATEYCQLTECNENSTYQTFHEVSEKVCHPEIAITLSRYCVYLIDSVSELLTGYVDSELAIARVMKEVREAIGSLSIDAKCQFFKDLQVREEEDTIFRKGVKLGKQLESLNDSALRWKVMAEFWVEKIIYIAPSDNAKGHMERLNKGGEFLTHIWALLSHAGILKINRDNVRTTNLRSQPLQEDV